MAIIWYDEAMPYCELEPLGAVWWEKRKGIATAILHEAANRVQLMFPECSGMLGGNQPKQNNEWFKICFGNLWLWKYS